MKPEPPKTNPWLDPSFFTWKSLSDYLLILLGSLIQALSMHLFLVPSNLVAGGVSGIAQIINSFTGWPIGLMVLVGNIPLFVLGFRYLGGPRFVLRTIVAIFSFSLFIDLLGLFFPTRGLTGDIVLNCLYGGLVMGVGLGLVYRGRGTSGGTDILGRILNHRMGISISQSYLVTDSLVVLLGGLAFDWAHALYGLVVIYVSGVAAEMSSEGSGIYRSVMIITSQTQAVSSQIMQSLERGVTILSGSGAYTGAERPVLYCVVTRSEVNQLKELVHEIDPQAFMVIGTAHEALGEGFRPLSKQ